MANEIENNHLLSIRMNYFSKSRGYNWVRTWRVCDFVRFEFVLKSNYFGPPHLSHILAHILLFVENNFTFKLERAWIHFYLVITLLSQSQPNDGDSRVDRCKCKSWSEREYKINGAWCLDMTDFMNSIWLQVSERGQCSPICSCQKVTFLVCTTRSRAHDRMRKCFISQ